MDDANAIRSALTGSFSIATRPEPVPGDLRVRWGQALLVLVLASARNQRCSIQKVHFLAHLSRTSGLRSRTRAVLAGHRHPSDLAVRIEPWVNRAAAFGKANGLIEVRDGKALALSDKGKATAKTLRTAGILAEEAAFLDEIGRRVTEQVVEKIMKMEAI